MWDDLWIFNVEATIRDERDVGIRKVTQKKKKVLIRIV